MKRNKITLLYIVLFNKNLLISFVRFLKTKILYEILIRKKIVFLFIFPIKIKRITDKIKRS